ncbi:MAG: C_GCAxxG_C_C family protein [Lachnospiraceae bacterium]|nr:C_GCAxxG_C_C family protein [Lachnospiraceae bacterium]
MQSRIEEAVKLFESGYGCCQAVFTTYADLFGIDRETALKLSGPLSAGIGRMREVCGVVSAMAMLTGLKQGFTDPSDEAGKTAAYEKVRTMSDRLKEEMGSILCRELLGLDQREESAKPAARTAEYYASRPCSRMVAAAAKVIEEELLLDDFM